MNLTGALHLCQCQDPDTKRASLIQEGYSFLVKQKPSQNSWDTGCILEIRVAGSSSPAYTTNDEEGGGRKHDDDPLVHEVFSYLSDCLFHLLSVYGFPDGGWWPAPRKRVVIAHLRGGDISSRSEVAA